MRFELAPVGLRRLRPPRRDGRALGFGCAFLVLGSALLARRAGLNVTGAWLASLILLCLGAAGLLEVARRRSG